MKVILLILLTIFFVQPAFADELAGLWETSSDKYIYFKEDGTFSFINSKIFTGYTWQRTEENTIKLHFFDFSTDKRIVLQAFPVQHSLLKWTEKCIR